jgi:hypothetical protein
MLNEHDASTHPDRPQGGFGSPAEICGIHPLNATAVVAVDFMCFGGELTSGFLLAIVSILVAAMLVVPCTLVQRYAYKDGWLLAFGKAMVLGVLTAIPTALPSALTIAWGVSGAVGLAHRRARERAAAAFPSAPSDDSNTIDMPN